jgi:hypothetical protein
MALLLPDCYFTLDGVQSIKAKTGLDGAQIQQWAEHMRYRVPAEKRAAYFADDEEKTSAYKTSARAHRIHISTFNVDLDFAKTFTFLNSRSGKNIEIVVLKAAFYKPAAYGEFFIEFASPIYEHLVVRRFKSLGACDVLALTFPKNINNVVSYAVLRIHMLAEKYNFWYSQGCLSNIIINGLPVDVKISSCLLENETYKQQVKTMFYVRTADIGGVLYVPVNDILTLAYGKTKCDVFKVYNDCFHDNMTSYQFPGNYGIEEPVITIEGAKLLTMNLYGKRVKALQVGISNMLEMYYEVNPQLPDQLIPAADEDIITEIPVFSWVYCTKSTAFPGLVKIGRTRDLSSRISSGNTFCAPAPHSFETIVPTFDSKRDEARVHKHFAEFRKQGEFFQVSVNSVQEYFSLQIMPLYQNELAKTIKAIGSQYDQLPISWKFWNRRTCHHN